MAKPHDWWHLGSPVPYILVFNAMLVIAVLMKSQGPDPQRGPDLTTTPSAWNRASPAVTADTGEPSKSLVQSNRSLGRSSRERVCFLSALYFHAVLVAVCCLWVSA